MESYKLQIEKTADGLTVDEQSDMSDFEIMGILSHLVQVHSIKLSKQLQDYENEKIKIEG